MQRILHWTRLQRGYLGVYVTGAVQRINTKRGLYRWLSNHTSQRQTGADLLNMHSLRTGLSIKEILSNAINFMLTIKATNLQSTYSGILKTRNYKWGTMMTQWLINEIIDSVEDSINQSRYCPTSISDVPRIILINALKVCTFPIAELKTKMIEFLINTRRKHFAYVESGELWDFL